VGRLAAGQMNGLMNRQMDGQTDRTFDGQMDPFAGGQINRLTDRSTYRQGGTQKPDRLTDKQTD
jgi:hypothetical protein